MSIDPLGLAEDVDFATARLQATARDLDDTAVAVPSLLPGWTLGHVLTHLARNADGAVNLLTWARTGVETPQYESRAKRDADIEQGAHRSAAALVADLTAACSRFAEAVHEMPPQAWSVGVRWTSGRAAPAAQVMWSRLREVEIHHVDLGRTYTPADWPEAFTLRMVRSLAHDLGERDDGPRIVIRSPEVGHDLTVGDTTEAPVVAGAAWLIVAWLVGRSTGDGLTVQPAGDLPRVPAWG